MNNHNEDEGSLEELLFKKIVGIEDKLDLLYNKLTVNTIPEEKPLVGRVKDNLPTPSKVRDIAALIKKENKFSTFIYEPNYIGLSVGVSYKEDGVLSDLFLINEDNTLRSIADYIDIVMGIPEAVPAVAGGVMVYGVLTCRLDNQPLLDYLCESGKSVKAALNRLLLAENIEGIEPYFIAFNASQSVLDTVGSYESLLIYLEKEQFIIPEEIILDVNDTDHIETEYWNKGVILKNGLLTEWPTKFGYAYHRTERIYNSHLLGINWQINHDGSLTAVGSISPVETHAGSFDLCILNGVDHYIKQGVNQGALLGLTIPHSMNLTALTIERFGNGRRLFKPSHCPLCGSELIGSKDTCANEKCLSLLKSKLVMSIWPHALDVNHLDHVDIIRLYEEGHLTSLAKFFTLTAEQLKSIGIHDKKAKKVINEFARVKKNRTLAFWLHALGIPSLTIGRCLSIEKYLREYHEYTNLDAVIEHLLDKQLLVEDYGIEVMGVPAYVTRELKFITEFLSFFDWTKFNKKGVTKFESVSIIGKVSVNIERLTRALYDKRVLLSETIVNEDKCTLIGDRPELCKLSLVSRYNLTSIDVVDMTIDQIVKTVTELKDEM